MTSWDAVLDFTDGLEWWNIPGVTWNDLAAVLNIGPRSVQHHFGILGWDFLGAYTTRQVGKAPCATCGVVHEAPRIIERLGPCCRNDHA